MCIYVAGPYALIFTYSLLTLYGCRSRDTSNGSWFGLIWFGKCVWKTLILGNAMSIEFRRHQRRRATVVIPRPSGLLHINEYKLM